MHTKLLSRNRYLHDSTCMIRADFRTAKKSLELNPANMILHALDTLNKQKVVSQGGTFKLFIMLSLSAGLLSFGIGAQ